MIVIGKNIMKNERDFKKTFKDSVKKHGGFAMSLSAPMISGLPDLYVSMPGYIPVLLEAKWLGSILRSKFKRKLQLTTLQKDVLKSCHNVTACSAMALIGFRKEGCYYAVLVPCGSPHFESITNECWKDCATCTYLGGMFNIDYLFESAPIPKLPGQPINIWTNTNDAVSMRA